MLSKYYINAVHIIELALLYLKEVKLLAFSYKICMFLRRILASTCFIVWVYLNVETKTVPYS